jgi:hypothetical protein
MSTHIRMDFVVYLADAMPVCGCVVDRRRTHGARLNNCQSILRRAQRCCFQTGDRFHVAVHVTTCGPVQKQRGRSGRCAPTISRRGYCVCAPCWRLGFTFFFLDANKCLKKSFFVVLCCAARLYNDSLYCSSNSRTLD